MDRNPSFLSPRPSFQPNLEAIFEKHLVSLDSKVHYGFELVSFTENKEDSLPLTVQVKPKNSNKVMEIKTKFLVGADGWKSQVRTEAGIEFPGFTYPTKYMLADVRLNDPYWPVSSASEAKACSYLGPAGTLLILPMPDRVTRIVIDDKTFDSKKSTSEYHGLSSLEPPPNIQDLQPELDRRGPEFDDKMKPNRIKEVVWSSRFRVHHKLAESFRKGNVLLVGDAAHVHR